MAGADAAAMAEGRKEGCIIRICDIRNNRNAIGISHKNYDKCKLNGIEESFHISV